MRLKKIYGTALFHSNDRFLTTSLYGSSTSNRLNLDNWNNQHPKQHQQQTRPRKVGGSILPIQQNKMMEAGRWRSNWHLSNINQKGNSCSINSFKNAQTSNFAELDSYTDPIHRQSNSGIQSQTQESSSELNPSSEIDIQASGRVEHSIINNSHPWSAEQQI
ncbi:MAG: hypothetical protein EZS28_030684 [Streblomastix strix]|uniref:Uncharacterized protein n=1 Tax=Streblomastix strix TaxID=222440 RepID=A0A5J4UTM2_9EUKA|nr:MAG: hypothetical protein EZS28_030684 [Streblomastix strix]